MDTGWMPLQLFFYRKSELWRFNLHGQASLVSQIVGHSKVTHVSAEIWDMFVLGASTCSWHSEVQYTVIVTDVGKNGSHDMTTHI